MLRSTSLHGAKDTKSDPIVSSLSWFIFHLVFSKQSLILFSVWWLCSCFDWSEQPASIISLWAKERRSNFLQCFFRCEAKHFWRENSNEMFLARKFKWDFLAGKFKLNYCSRSRFRCWTKHRRPLKSTPIPESSATTTCRRRFGRRRRHRGSLLWAALTSTSTTWGWRWPRRRRCRRCSLEPSMISRCRCRSNQKKT